MGFISSNWFDADSLTASRTYFKVSDRVLAAITFDLLPDTCEIPVESESKAGRTDSNSDSEGDWMTRWIIV